MQQAYATAAAAAQRQQRWQRAAQAVAAAAFRRGGSCASSGLCRGRVHGGGTCGVWQRRRQRWVWRQHWQQRRRLLMPHAACGAWARRCSGDSPTLLLRPQEYTLRRGKPESRQEYTWQG